MKTRAFVCIACLLFAGWVADWWSAPSLSLVQTAPEVVRVDVQTLGEYQATVNRIRLYDVNQGTVVWEIASQNGDAQIHQFILKTGENPAALDAAAGAYSVIVPKGADRFALHKGTKYRLDLSNGSTVFSKSSATFTFGNSTIRRR
jgi:hypothetical protein